METNATLPAKLSALPDAWIGRIFEQMTAFYGALFLDRWRDVDALAVRQVWSERLASFSDDPACFGRALDEVFEGCRLPPTLPEFAAICRRCYRPPVPLLPALEAKPSHPELVQDRLRECKRLLGRLFAA